MQVFNITPDKNFCEELARFYIENIGEDNFSKTVFFLPNHRLKKELCQYIAKAKPAILLPRIFSLGDANQIIEIANTDKNPAISPYTKTLKIAEILKENFSGKIEEENLYSFSLKIGKLLDEMAFEGSEIENLEKIILENDFAQHATEVLFLIKTVQEKYQDFLQKNGFALEKETIFSLNQVAKILQEENQIVIFAGTNASYNFVKDFIASFIDYKKSYFFFANFSSTNFFQQRLAGLFEVSFPEYRAATNAIMIECENVSKEVELLVNLIHQNQDDKKSLAIITPNYPFALHLYKQLEKKGLKTNFGFGINATENFYIRLIYNYLLFLEAENDTTKKLYSFLNIIKDDYFYAYKNEASEVENKIIRKRFFNSFDELLVEIADKISSTEFKATIKTLNESLPNNLSIGEFFQAVINLFPYNYSDEIKEFFAEILAIKNMGFSYAEKIKILKQILLNKKFNLPQNVNYKVHFLHPIEARLLQFDNIIIPNLNQNIWENDEDFAWIGKSILESLNLNRILNISHLTFADLDWHSYNFTKNLFLTRAVQENFEMAEISTWGIKYLSANNLEPLKIKPIPLQEAENTKKDIPILSQEFYPKSLSISNIALLLSNPFAFYIEKILGLRQLNEVNALPENKDYGIVFHKAIELFYTNKNYQEIIEKMIENYPKITQIIWREKIFAVLKKIEKLNGNNFFEQEYKANLNNFVIKGRFDHLNISGTNFSIIDYKTGLLPTKKEIENFAKAQVQILFFILVKNGIIKENYQPDFLGYRGFKDEFEEIKIPLHTELFAETEQKLEKTLTFFFGTEQKPFLPKGKNIQNIEFLEPIPLT
jgi:inactivated superfamily I helicase